MTYIDTKTLNRCKKELRRLATRSYSENETIRILESFITWANRDDDPWATSQTLVEQYKMADPEKPYTSWLVDSAACAFESNDINGEAMKILLPPTRNMRLNSRRGRSNVRDPDSALPALSTCTPERLPKCGIGMIQTLTTHQSTSWLTKSRKQPVEYSRSAMTLGSDAPACLAVSLNIVECS